ncbi:MAG: hypothetical protein AB7P03_27695 [Kofleriaceae bacterium]
MMLVAIVLGSLSGCEDSRGSGLDPGRKIVDLTQQEHEALCGYVAEMTEGPRTVTCDDQDLELPGKQECLEELVTFFPTLCTVTVADAEACWDLVGDDPCNYTSDECVDYYSCGVFATDQVGQPRR